MSKFKKGRPLNGVLLLDKPIAISSNAALQQVKKIFQANKAGHTGSLDPLATGMLPICFGEATKFSEFLLTADKHYAVVAKLGIKTTTGDQEGEVIATKPVPKLSSTLLETQLQQFRGTIQQIPSMYSALKYNGQPLYALARQGIEVERPSRTIQIYHLELSQFSDDELHLNVFCSKGTYIRTLVEDLGDKLGCGAHVIELRRTAIGNLPNTMVTIPQLVASAELDDMALLDEHLLGIDQMLTHLPKVIANELTCFYLHRGQAVRLPQLPTVTPSSWISLYNEQETFIGVGQILDDGRISPKRLIQQHNV